MVSKVNGSSPSQSGKCSLTSSLSWRMICSLSIIALAILPVAYGIHCWKCNSLIDGACADIPAGPPAAGSTSGYDKYYVDCSREPSKQNSSGAVVQATFCRLIHQMIDEKESVVRSCGYERSHRDCYQTANPPTKTTVCQCDTDGCNPASTVSTSTALIATMMSFALVMFLQFN